MIILEWRNRVGADLPQGDFGLLREELEETGIDDVLLGLLQVAQAATESGEEIFSRDLLSPAPQFELDPFAHPRGFAGLSVARLAGRIGADRIGQLFTVAEVEAEVAGRPAVRFGSLAGG